MRNHGEFSNIDMSEYKEAALNFHGDIGDNDVLEHLENLKNIKIANKKPKGAYFDKVNGKHYSQIKYNKQYHWLGYFPNAEEASKAYHEAYDRLHAEDINHITS